MTAPVDRAGLVAIVGGVLMDRLEVDGDEGRECAGHILAALEAATLRALLAEREALREAEARGMLRAARIASKVMNSGMWCETTADHIYEEILADANAKEAGDER